MNVEKWISRGVIVASLLLSLRAFYLSGSLYNKFIEPMLTQINNINMVLQNHKDVIEAVVVQNTKVLDSIRRDVMKGETIKNTPPVSKGDR